MADQIKSEIGYFFHNSLKAETEPHEDCICALAKTIGHTEASFHNYKHICSVWNIKRNSEIEVKSERKKGGKDKNKSFDDLEVEKEQRGGSMVDIQRSISDDEIDKRSVRSFKSEQDQSFRVKIIFADQKNMKKL